MADSLTVKFPNGQADVTALDPANSATSTGVGAKEFMTGPPLFGAARTQGRYVCSVAGAAGTFKWVADEPITGASPTLFNYASGLPAITS